MLHRIYTSCESAGKISPLRIIITTQFRWPRVLFSAADLASSFKLSLNTGWPFLVIWGNNCHLKALQHFFYLMKHDSQPLGALCSFSGWRWNRKPGVGSVFRPYSIETLTWASLFEASTTSTHQPYCAVAGRGMRGWLFSVFGMARPGLKVGHPD